MKQLLAACIFALLFCITGCTSMPGINKVKGSGVKKTEKRDVGQFASVEMDCPGVINLTAQERPGFEISGDDNIVPLITTEVKNNTLYIKSTKDYDPQGKLQINVSNPDFERFVFSGAGEATLSKIMNERLEVKVSGAGEVKASGETKEADISLTGAGTIDAKDLHSIKTKVSSTGVGSIDVYAAEQLDANATGVGDINYYGNPKLVNKQASGMGHIAPR
jgi:Putative auto-transporter adhesin, head GIN domain